MRSPSHLQDGSGMQLGKSSSTERRVVSVSLGPVEGENIFEFSPREVRSLVQVWKW